MPIAVMIEFEREHEIDDDDLQDHQQEAARAAALLLALLLGFDLGMNLVGCLGDQEQPAPDQDQVAPGQAEAGDRDHRLRQTDQPHQGAEQENPKQQRQRQPDLPRPCGLLLRNPGDDDRQEDDIVDAEHDFECGQRQQRGPGFRAGQECDHALNDLSNRIAESLATM